MAPEDFNDPALVQEFLVEAEEHLHALDDDLLALERAGGADAATTELVENMFRATHTVKGLAAMFDFADIKDLSHAMESVFQAFRAGERCADERCLEVLFSGVDALKDAVAAVSGGHETPSSAREAIDAIASLLDSGDPSVGSDPGEPDDRALSEYAQARIAEAEAEGLRPVRLTLRWGIELRLDSLRVSAVERALGRGEVLEIRPLLDGLVVLEQVDSAASDVSVEVIALTDLADGEIGDRLGVSASAIRTLGTGVAEEDSQQADARSGSKEGTGHIVRVDIGRLDSLMDLTGEIVTARTRIDELIATVRTLHRKEEAVQELVVAAKGLSRLVDGLQDQVTRLRMVPVRQMFSKFPRTVRDLARGSGKEIEIVFEGEETELDKRLIEQVEESLLHMVRNACDHGIESPDEREASGKPRQGTLRLAAGHEGNHIVVEVGDDGRGLDVGRIWARAIESGRVAPEQEFDESLVSELIMESGFSTTDVATDVSGRGVGLDVVRKKLAELGGSISLETEFRVGTTFRLRMPLTLAIMSALLVREAGRQFAVPIAAVSEVLRVRPGEIRTIRDSSVMDVRGEALPVTFLGSALGFAERANGDSGGFVVVVSGVGHRLGMVVDGLLGQQQMVVKSLEEALGPTAGIGGATILGDGSVVPIIDVDGVVDIVAQRCGRDSPGVGEVG